MMKEKNSIKLKRQTKEIICNTYLMEIIKKLVW